MLSQKLIRMCSQVKSESAFYSFTHEKIGFDLYYDNVDI